jgi:hypothetical protein
MILISKAADYSQVSDLLDAYFAALREYNRALGAYDMTAEQLQHAREREAESYARVRALKEQLLQRCGIPV